MYPKLNRCLVLVATVALVGAWCMVTVNAQITFSRDWTGGKRASNAIPGKPTPFDCQHISRVCRHFIHELKAMKSDIPWVTQHEETNYYDDQQ